MKKIIVAFVLLTLINTLFAENNKTTIAIMPFTGKEYADLNGEIIANNIYIQLIKMPAYSVITTDKITEYRTKYLLPTDEYYYLEYIMDMMKKFNADIIVAGKFNIDKNNLNISLDIFGRKRKVSAPLYFSVKIDKGNIEALNKIMPKLIKPFSEYNPKMGNIIIRPNEECIFMIDGVNAGKKPDNFWITEGKHTIELVYENQFAKGSVFKKEIEVKSGDIIDLGELKVDVKVTIEANVKADVFINKIKVGTSDTVYKLPINNSYNISLEYFDNEIGENRIIEGDITTNDKDVIYKREFPCRIKLGAQEPLKGRVIDINSKSSYIFPLPHTFDDLNQGNYKVQTVLVDPQDNKEYIIREDYIELKNVETKVITVPIKNYEPNYWMFLIPFPGPSQICNYEETKGKIYIGLAALTAAEIITTAILLKNNYDTISSNYYIQNEYNNLINNQNILRTLFFGGLISYGILITYSTVDGILNLNKINSLFHSKI